jgi:hypothetical protein
MRGAALVQRLVHTPQTNMVDAPLSNDHKGFIDLIEDLAIAPFPNVPPRNGSCHRGLSRGSESGVQQIINPPSTIRVGEGIPDLPSFAAPD